MVMTENVKLYAVETNKMFWYKLVLKKAKCITFSYLKSTLHNNQRCSKNKILT